MASILKNTELKRYPITYTHETLIPVVCSCQLPPFKSDDELATFKRCDVIVHDKVEACKLQKSTIMFEAAIRGHIDISDGDGEVSPRIIPKCSIDASSEWLQILDGFTKSERDEHEFDVYFKERLLRFKMAIAVGFVDLATDTKKGCKCLACKPAGELEHGTESKSSLLVDNKVFRHIDKDGHTQILAKPIKPVDYVEGNTIIKFRAIRDIIRNHLLLLKVEPMYYFYLLFPNMVGPLHISEFYKTTTFRYMMSLQLGYIDYKNRTQIDCDCLLCECGSETQMVETDDMTGHKKHLR